jgi:hypothetical protein
MFWKIWMKPNFKWKFYDKCHKIEVKVGYSAQREPSYCHPSLFPQCKHVHIFFVGCKKYIWCCMDCKNNRPSQSFVNRSLCMYMHTFCFRLLLQSLLLSTINLRSKSLELQNRKWLRWPGKWMWVSSVTFYMSICEVVCMQLELDDRPLTSAATKSFILDHPSNGGVRPSGEQKAAWVH